MLIKKRNSIFIHIPKVAGQSIEHFFLDDIGIKKSEALDILVGPNLDPKKGPPKLAHLTALDHLTYGYLEEKDFNEAFKFSFVRNPWSRTVSFYKFLGFQNFISFDYFLKNYFLTDWFQKNYWFVRPQADFVTDAEGKLIVDFVGKFESINKDFEQVLSMLNMPNQSLPYFNKTKQSYQKIYHTLRRNPKLVYQQLFSFSDKHKGFRDYYTDENKEQVAKLYKKDIELFNYSF